MTDIEQAKSTLGEQFSFFFDVIYPQLQRLQLDKNARILDVGTGMGRVAMTLALCGHRVLTGEPTDDRSEYAKQAWREQAQKIGVDEAITFEPFDAEQLPFADQGFDAVFVMGSLHHMSDPAAAVAECVRVLAPGGVLCILEPNAAMIELVRTKHPDHPDPTDPTPFVQDAMALERIREEKFDVFLIRRPS
jgi:ubiquinone/menaquinone biosynthesis C-methylase UbiE